MAILRFCDYCGQQEQDGGDGGTTKSPMKTYYMPLMGLDGVELCEGCFSTLCRVIEQWWMGRPSFSASPRTH